MKILTTLFCLFLSVTALAQSRDKVHNDTSRGLIIRDPVMNAGKALIVIDGSIYNGDLNKLNPDDILNVEIVKGIDAVLIFGSQASSGAIIIQTKFPLLTDTIKKHLLVDSIPGDSAVYILDGKLSDKRLGGIEKKDIFSVDVIKKDEAAKIFDGSARNGLVVVVTNTAAIERYQRILGDFSKAYKSYLDHHQKNDGRFLYFANTKPLQGYRKDIIKALYNIPIEKITSVYFSLQDTPTPGTAMVLISTKQ
jgi:hypothetical protein